MHTRDWLIVTLEILVLAGCRSYVQEPWVPQDGYLQQERARSAQLERQLDDRLHWQQDR
jgi:uncharacterized protein YcfL